MNPNCRTEVGTTPLILYLLQESQAGQTYQEDPVNLATSYKMLYYGHCTLLCTGRRGVALHVGSLSWELGYAVGGTAVDLYHLCKKSC